MKELLELNDGQVLDFLKIVPNDVLVYSMRDATDAEFGVLSKFLSERALGLIRDEVESLKTNAASGVRAAKARSVAHALIWWVQE